MNIAEIKALTFDVFGTVTDWRSTIIQEGATWGAQKGSAMHWVCQGQLPWLNIDCIHRQIVEKLLVKCQIDGLTEAKKVQWNRFWHQLELWPDVKPGLERLCQRFVCKRALILVEI